MPAPVCDGSRMQCSMGDGEATLRVDTRGVTRNTGSGSAPAGGSAAGAGGSSAGSSDSSSSSGGGSMATTDDCIPLVHIPPFRGCKAQVNPNPVLPTGRRLCTPRPTGLWSSEIKCITLQDKKLVEQRATLRCIFGGTISFLDAGQEGVQVDDNLLENPSAFGAASGPVGGASKESA